LKAADRSRYEQLLAQALVIAQKKALSKPQIVSDVLATGKVEGEDPKHAVVSYRAQKYNSVWRTLIEWRFLAGSTAEDWADSMIETVETNVQMSESGSWPKPPDC
jgi:hypothetical protein